MGQVWQGLLEPLTFKEHIIVDNFAFDGSIK